MNLFLWIQSFIIRNKILGITSPKLYLIFVTHQVYARKIIRLIKLFKTLRFFGYLHKKCWSTKHKKIVIERCNICWIELVETCSCILQHMTKHYYIANHFIAFSLVEWRFFFQCSAQTYQFQFPKMVLSRLNF